MPSEKIGEYEVECSAVELIGAPGWVAHLAIYGHSHNPMHRNNVFPDQRVSLDAVFPTKEEAEAEAHRVALTMLTPNSNGPGEH
ncbi:hypothetical protein [Herminiimonas contaminans]|uniref:Uncharacterized protein n=1 Tax=Herminiimonas contaminans TaxID=1111140 RepID=A0ABS0EPL3_9BURK|nr:hypothetical protein [Herminiimonas contaminans]MBF8176799.1 hypothetical protein [Herminiimonas contaminans]